MFEIPFIPGIKFTTTPSIKWRYFFILSLLPLGNVGMFLLFGGYLAGANTGFYPTLRAYSYNTFLYTIHAVFPAVFFFAGLYVFRHRKGLKDEAEYQKGMCLMYGIVDFGIGMGILTQAAMFGAFWQGILYMLIHVVVGWPLQISFLVLTRREYMAHPDDLIEELSNQLNEALVKDRLDLLEAIFSRREYPRLQKRIVSYHDLAMIAVSNNSPNCLKLLIDRGFSMKGTNGEGDDLLFVATKGGFSEALDCLLDNSNRTEFDVNQVNKSGQAPIHLAAFHDHPQVIRTLVGYGCDVNKMLPKTDLTPLHIAVTMNNMECVKTLVEESDAEINVLTFNGVYQGKTPMIEAKMKNNQPMMEYLVDHGADVNTYHYEITGMKEDVLEVDEYKMDMLADLRDMHKLVYTYHDDPESLYPDTDDEEEGIAEEEGMVEVEDEEEEEDEGEALNDIRVVINQ